MSPLPSLPSPPPPPKRRRVPFRARRFVPANKLINEQTSGDINERQEPIISADMNVAQSKQGRVVVLFLLPLLATGSLTFARPIQFSDLLRKEKLSSHEMYFFFFIGDLVPFYTETLLFEIGLIFSFIAYIYIIRNGI